MNDRQTSDNPRIRRVLIVGGGTAGWLTAGLLAKHLNCANSDEIAVTLVESPTIPILGVGEGTWPTIRKTLQTLEIDETDFIRECDATFKQGSEFVNWANTPEEGERSSYHHPLSSVFHSAYDFNLAAYWLLGKKPSGVAYDEAIASQAHMCANNRAPKKITTPAYAAIQNYSYHLDANKFAKFLQTHCVTKLGVKHLVADVTEVKLEEDGYISSVGTEQLGSLEADFFVDCTGAKALLIGGALEVKYHTLKSTIFNDTALAAHVPYQGAHDQIATHTLATAHESGWTWDIGLSERRGVGFVYSSAYTEDIDAERMLRGYIGGQSESISIRKIRFESGFRDKFWHKNCLAIGMSAAFIEPLEASAIFLVEAAVNMLTDQFPNTREDMRYIAKQYNSIFHLRWDKTVDFVKLHYCISKRRDHAYWIDNCDASTIPDSLLAKLDHWRSHIPSKYDFDYAFEPFVLDSYLFVLYGMEFETDLSSSLHRYTDWGRADLMFADIQRSVTKLNLELPLQRALLEQVNQHGFSKI